MILLLGGLQTKPRVVFFLSYPGCVVELQHSYCLPFKKRHNWGEALTLQKDQLRPPLPGFPQDLSPNTSQKITTNNKKIKIRESISVSISRCQIKRLNLIEAIYCLEEHLDS